MIFGCPILRSGETAVCLLVDLNYFPSILVIFGYPVLRSGETAVYLATSYILLWKGYLLHLPSILVTFGHLEALSA